MRISELKISSRPSRKRAGRGISAGQGKTAGRGTKGQNSRSGGQRNPGFEGGQNPLFQRIPKNKGFRSLRTKPAIIQTSQLELVKSATIDLKKLREVGLVSKKAQVVKLLFDEPLKKAYKLEITAASQKAAEAVEQAGGSISFVELPKASDKPKPTKPAKDKA